MSCIEHRREIPSEDLTRSVEVRRMGVEIPSEDLTRSVEVRRMGVEVMRVSGR
jgi:hypothetical protein